MDVPFVDLKRQYAPLLPEIKATMDSIIERCAFINGPEVREIEQKMANWLGVLWVCGVSNGTHALYLTLKTLGIGKGDEVITVANTAFPTSEAINSSGADDNIVTCVNFLKEIGYLFWIMGQVSVHLKNDV